MVEQFATADRFGRAVTAAMGAAGLDVAAPIADQDEGARAVLHAFRKIKKYKNTCVLGKEATKSRRTNSEMIN